MRLGVSPVAASTPTGRGLRLYFPKLEPWVARSVLLSICLASSWFIFTRVWDLLIYQPPTCCKSSPPGCHSPPPSIGLDECFFFNSLSVGVPYSLIFCQFWLFLNLLSFFWLWEEEQCVCLCLHLGWKSTLIFLSSTFPLCLKINT